MTIVCPFCGLLCGDLAVAAGAIDTRGCAKAAQGFARATAGGSHAVAGRAASLDEAAAAAAQILNAARQPLIAGLGADLDGIRAALALAERIGAIVDHRLGSAALRNLAEVQAGGWMTATFSEVANRADVVLIAGEDPGTRFPRFFERLVRNAEALYRAGPPWVAHLGTPGNDPAISDTLATSAEGLLDAVTALAAIARGRTLRADSAGGVATARIQAIAERLAAARYGVVCWDAGSLPEASAPLVIDALIRLVRALNRKTRCVGLPLGGSDNALGAVQAMLWQAGWPGRISYADGTPRHDPWRNDAGRLLAAGEVDALMWISALSATPPPATTAPVIAVVAGDIALPAPAAVELRVGCPAIDHGGTMVRADTVVALPLTAARPSAALRAGDALRAVLRHLPARAA